MAESAPGQCTTLPGQVVHVAPEARLSLVKVSWRGLKLKNSAVKLPATRGGFSFRKRLQLDHEHQHAVFIPLGAAKFEWC